MEALWAALSGTARPALLRLCAPLDTLAEALGQGGVDPADPLANLRLAVAFVLLVSGCERPFKPLNLSRSCAHTQPSRPCAGAGQCWLLPERARGWLRRLPHPSTSGGRAVLTLAR